MTMKLNPNVFAEIVLPSGVFFRLHRPILNDFLVVAHATRDRIQVVQAYLASQCGTFDGEKRTPEEILAMPAEEAVPIIRQVNKLLEIIGRALS